MRKPAFRLLITAALLVPATAWSQPRPSPSAPTPEDYVCTFSGDCGQVTSQDDNNPNGPRPRISATRGFALSRAEPGGDQTAARRQTPAPRQRMARNLAEPRSSSSVTSRHRASASASIPAAGPGQRVNLRLSFITGSAELAPGARAQADAFAQALMRPQLMNMRFRIEGHTDSVGRRDRNIDLSQRRAQTLADLLIQAGVSRDRLEVRGFGPDRPLPGLSARSGENRRVEAVRIS